MTDNVLTVRDLSKKYSIGGTRARGEGLRHVIEDVVRGPGRWWTGSSPRAGEEFWALRDVSFDVGRGEAVGIIGRNGAGKSTLLKVLSRITPPTSGSVRLRGRVASLLEVGTGFHPELTGRENVYLNGAILGMTRAEIRARFDEIVAFAEIDRFLDTPVKRYSSGMYVRLAFAVAAYLEPDVLIVDEVLAVGDAQFQKKCLGKMGEVGRSGRTVLLVSHNLHAVKTLCTRGIVLAGGRVDYSGTAEGAVERYQATLEDVAAPELSAEDVPEGDVRFVAWRLANGEAGRPYTCHTRDECEFEFTLVCRRPLTRLHLSFVIRGLDDTILISGHNRENGGIPPTLDRGIYRVIWRTRVPLRAGMYRLEAGSASEDEGHVPAHSWRPGNLLEVLDHQLPYLPPAWQGVVNEPVACEVRRDSPEPAN